MSNMAYCRFQNTLIDLLDCFEHMDETDGLSKEESKARKRIIEISKDIIESFEEET